MALQSLRLFEVIGEKENKSVHCDSGLEQEFFLVDRDLYNARSDLMLAGRTLVGNVPPKGQQVLVRLLRLWYPAYLPPNHAWTAPPHSMLILPLPSPPTRSDGGPVLRVPVAPLAGLHPRL